MAAKLVRDTATISMDPYCILRLGTQEYQTSQDRAGDKSPEWLEEFQFQVEPGNDIMHISLWDKNRLSKDKEIGCVNLLLVDLFEKKVLEDWVEIMHDDQSAGHIKLHMTFTPEARVQEGERTELPRKEEITRQEEFFEG
jgi:Ca2+-dependent lipid-binding protein